MALFLFFLQFQVRSCPTIRKLVGDDVCVCVGVVFCYCQNCWQLLYVMLVTQPSSNQQRVGQEINTTSDELNLDSSKNTFHSAWLRRSWAELLAKNHTHTTDNNKKKYTEKVNNNNNNISSASKRNQPTKSIVRRCCFVCDPLQSRVGFVSFCGALCLLLLFNFSTLTTSKRTFFTGCLVLYGFDENILNSTNSL